MLLLTASKPQNWRLRSVRMHQHHLDQRFYEPSASESREQMNFMLHTQRCYQCRGELYRKLQCSTIICPSFDFLSPHISCATTFSRNERPTSTCRKKTEKQMLPFDAKLKMDERVTKARGSTRAL
ncbi:uncharacterized protein V6R79_017638 [Siganus canaliculatus]